jgi:hypothetical protein
MKTKIVEVRGSRYQLSKLKSDIGSYIYYRMMGALLEFKQAATENEVPSTTPKMKDDEKARMLCGMAVMKLSFEDLQFTNRYAMQAVSKEVLGSPDTFIQVMQDTGRWVEEAIADDPGLHQALVMESLTFSLAPFFSESGEVKATSPATTNR